MIQDSGTVRHRLSLLLLLLFTGALWHVLAQSGEPVANKLATSEPQSASTGVDSLTADSLRLDSLQQARALELRHGPLFTDIVRERDRLWVCGDSGLVAWSRNDSTWNRLAGSGSPLALNCLVSGAEKIFAAGDSGTVLLAAGDTLLSRSLDDPRDICAIAMEDGTLRVCGGGGLFALSKDAGRSWTVGTLPEPARYLAQLVEGETWTVGGTGGFLFRSTDDGQSWQQIPRRDYTPIVALLATPGGTLLALGDGRVERMLASGQFETVASAFWGDSWMLHALPDGWVLGGSGGNLGLMRGGEFTELRLDRYSLFSGAVTRGNTVMLCGSRGLMASLNPETDELSLIHNSLTRRQSMPELIAAGDTLLAVSDSAGSRPTLNVSSDSTQYLFSLLDGNPGVADNQNKLDRLARNYNQASFLGEPGFAILLVDVSASGQLEHGEVLDEYPRNLGFGSYALEILNSLEFTPGLLDGKFVRTRLLYSLHFPLFTSNENPWYTQDGYEAGVLMDSLSAWRPRIESGLSLKEFVKKLDFPRKARRYSWDGEALLSYQLLPGQEPSNVVLLRESPEELGFGEHSLEVLPKLGLQADSLDPLFPRLHVQHKLHFDRRYYSKPAKAIKEGHRFSESLYTVALVDSSRFNPGLANLGIVLREFMGEGMPTGQIDMVLGLRFDGRIVSAEISSPDEDLEEAVLNTVRDLVMLFCWGYPVNVERGAPVDTLRLSLTLPPTGSAEQAPIAPLFEGVRF